MGRNSNSSSDPYFCKFLTTDDHCNSMFQIPLEFVENYGENLPQHVTFRINESGKSWRIGIEKIGGDLFFKDGWNKFAEEVDVKLQEYLIFKFLGLSNASSNESTPPCNKDLKSSEIDDDHDEWPIEKANDIHKYDGSSVGKKWRFVKELKEHHAFRLSIPKEFAVGTGIANDRRLVLVDACGENWPVRVTYPNGSFAMSSGWRAFLIGNRVAVGSIVSLEYISSSENLVEVRVLENSVKGGCVKPRPFALVKSHGPRRRKKAVITEEEEDNGTDNEDDHISNPEVSGFGKIWRFVKELKQHHASMMEIPQDFAMGTCIETKEKIKLRDAKGRNWPIDLRQKKCGLVAMAAGWNDFLVGNKVRVRNTVSFEFVEGGDNVIEVRLLYKGGKRNELFQSIKRGRGRPPSYL